MPKARHPTKVAIACQGGASHTAFTAGVLKRLLAEDGKNFEIVALSGTSGGAYCATLAWYGLLQGDRARGIALLDAFWQELATSSPTAHLLNDALVWRFRFQYLFSPYTFPNPSISPYALPNTSQDYLKQLLKKYVDFARIRELYTASSPALIIGATKVFGNTESTFPNQEAPKAPAERLLKRLQHKFKSLVATLGSTLRVSSLPAPAPPEKRANPGSKNLFKNWEISPEAILASSAIPTLFRAVQVGQDVYWDGLYEENPPIRELAQEKPDEIWVIQITPETAQKVPTSPAEIAQRQFELTSNLSLNKELAYIEHINKLLADKKLVNTSYKQIEIKRIELLQDLDVASLLDRSPAFIQHLMAHGEQQAEKFLSKQRVLSQH